MPSRSPTVFVVDDDDLMRESLCTLLGVLGYAVLDFNGPDAFHEYYGAEMPGCLLADIRMPRQSGLELYEQLLRESKKLPVIFITAHADVTTAVAAIKTGAIEFLEKPFDCDTLVARVEKALALDAEWRRADAEFTCLDEMVHRLTPRERETIAFIQTGETNKSIAAKLDLTERAVEMRRTAIMRKLEVRSAAEVIDVCATHRILADLRRAAAERIGS